MEKRDAKKQLRDWLDSGGRKITWLADAIPVNRSHLHQWLNGRHMPREVYRRRIEEITDGAVLPEDWE